MSLYVFSGFNASGYMWHIAILIVADVRLGALVKRYTARPEFLHTLNKPSTLTLRL